MLTYMLTVVLPLILITVLIGYYLYKYLSRPHVTIYATEKGTVSSYRNVDFKYSDIVYGASCSEGSPIIKFTLRLLPIPDIDVNVSFVIFNNTGHTLEVLSDVDLSKKWTIEAGSSLDLTYVAEFPGKENYYKITE